MIVTFVAIEVSLGFVEQVGRDGKEMLLAMLPEDSWSPSEQVESAISYITRQEEQSSVSINRNKQTAK